MGGGEINSGPSSHSVDKTDHETAVLTRPSLQVLLTEALANHVPAADGGDILTDPFTDMPVVD